MEKLGETFTGLVGWRNWEKLSLSERLAAPNVSARAQLVEKKEKKGGENRVLRSEQVKYGEARVLRSEQHTQLGGAQSEKHTQLGSAQTGEKQALINR